MFKKVTYPVFVLMGLLLTLNVSAKSETIEREFSVATGGQLVIDSDRGSIEIESWNNDQVDVEVRKSASSQSKLDDFRVEIENRGDNVYINGDGDGWNSNVRVKYIVKVPKKYNLDLKTGGGSIKVDDMAGNIKLHTSGGSLKIGNVDGGNVDAHTSGGSIKVGDVKGNLKVDTSGGSIRLGHVTGKATVDTSGGSISIESGGEDIAADTSGGSIKIGPSEGNVKAETSGGSIKIGTAKGDVDADTSGGSVKVEGAGGKVRVESSGGSLYVGSSGGPVYADTAGGSIKIYKARGAINAETSGGSIVAEMIETDNSKDQSVSLDSSGGDLTIYLPETIAATVSASLRVTRNSRRDYKIYSDFPLTIKGEDSKRITAEGDLGGGGDRVRLTTTNGDIYIKKLD
ncbi:DUF4097 domain-containing protein [Aliikangiella marina]|uniref:DUF4097 domain-containing protein n=1 Tax=Aliikangiella marina TaxID=1712262 RepID=A0A545T4E0_9GAMM|nr:DUF4097 family beta strand repeat-containing protein [Aliikangiella marina]TQV72089.1 DUF4097 domain-containing protein [Aliikangiella marina]